MQATQSYLNQPGDLSNYNGKLILISICLLLITTEHPDKKQTTPNSISPLWQCFYLYFSSKTAASLLSICLSICVCVSFIEIKLFIFGGTLTAVFLSKNKHVPLKGTMDILCHGGH